MKYTIASLLSLLCVFTLLNCKKNTPTNTGTCSDGILNQDETAIDCGGKCSVCTTCSDGIQNQGETGIDCGGPCQKCPIIYPANGYYGANFLRLDTLTLKGMAGPTSQPSHFYSLKAELPDNSTLRVRITIISGGGWFITLGAQTGWLVGTYQYPAGYQEFSATGKLSCDMSIFFKGNGAATMEVYENGATSPTRVKQLTWN